MLSLAKTTRRDQFDDRTFRRRYALKEMPIAHVLRITKWDGSGTVASETISQPIEAFAGVVGVCQTEADVSNNRTKSGVEGGSVAGISPSGSLQKNDASVAVCPRISRSAPPS